MKTLSGTSLTSEMGCDRQMMEDTLPLGFVTLEGDSGVSSACRNSFQSFFHVACSIT